MGWRFILAGILFALAGPLLPVDALTQSVQKDYSAAGQLNPLDNTNLSARAAALGSAFVGVADDASALFSNPAGLALLTHGELAFHNNYWLVDTLQATAVVGMPTLHWGGIGAAISYLDFGTYQGRDELGSLYGGYSAHRLELQGGWGIGILPGLSVGAALRGAQESLENLSCSSFAFDIGALAVPLGDLRIGMSYANSGWFAPTGVTASAFNIGGSYRFNLDSSTRLLTALSGSIEPDAVSYIQAGMEAGFFSTFFVRAGYQSALTDNRYGGFSGLTLGAGLSWKGFNLDYAYLPYGDLGATNHFSLGYEFDVVSKTASAAATQAVASATPTAPKPAGSEPTQGGLTVQFNLPPDLVAQGKALEAQGRLNDAMRFYLGALKQDNRNINAWYALGRGYYQLKQKPYAIQCFQNVLKLQPNNQVLADWLEKYKASTP
jgi:hypothetical protein